MNRLFAYIQESRAELAKVTWPTRKQATKLTITVVVFSVLFAVTIGAIDFGFSQILQKIILKG